MNSNVAKPQNAGAADVAAATATSTSNAAHDQHASELARMGESKLLSKYPTGSRGPGGHPSLLQKFLQKGKKFFDSGDYQMAKQTAGDKNLNFADEVVTGKAIPTPETVPARKSAPIEST